MNRRCALLGLSLAVALASAGPAHADGCFVWDKERDIAGPTQKAILFYADGRQDLLLQVRYEGPVEVLQRLSGARAVELAMPLLRDPDPVVRKRAWFFFEVVAGTDFAGDPARVEKWWAGRQTGPGSD